MIYHTVTQLDYDDLMEYLEKKGYKWSTGSAPTEINLWDWNQEHTCIRVEDGQLTFVMKDTATKSDPGELLSLLEAENGRWYSSATAIIPSYIGSWITFCQQFEFGIKHALEERNMERVYPEDIRKMITSWLDNPDNEKTFLSAWIEGYYMEEMLFHVKLPLIKVEESSEEPKTEYVYLTYNEQDGQTRFESDIAGCTAPWRSTLTFREIVDIDERYSKFTIPVEEDKK